MWSAVEGDGQPRVRGVPRPAMRALPAHGGPSTAFATSPQVTGTFCAARPTAAPHPGSGVEGTGVGRVGGSGESGCAFTSRGGVGAA